MGRISGVRNLWLIALWLLGAVGCLTEQLVASAAAPCTDRVLPFPGPRFKALIPHREGWSLLYSTNNRLSFVALGPDVTVERGPIVLADGRFDDLQAYEDTLVFTRRLTMQPELFSGTLRRREAELGLVAQAYFGPDGATSPVIASSSEGLRVGWSRGSEVGMGRLKGGLVEAPIVFSADSALKPQRLFARSAETWMLTTDSERATVERFSSADVLGRLWEAPATAADATIDGGELLTITTDGAEVVVQGVDGSRPLFRYAVSAAQVRLASSAEGPVAGFVDADSVYVWFLGDEDAPRRLASPTPRVTTELELLATSGGVIVAYETEDSEISVRRVCRES